eukprot:PhF_6_TR29060/c0_g1_i1/m.42333
MESPPPPPPPSGLATESSSPTVNNAQHRAASSEVVNNNAYIATTSSNQSYYPSSTMANQPYSSTPKDSQHQSISSPHSASYRNRNVHQPYGDLNQPQPSTSAGHANVSPPPPPPPPQATQQSWQPANHNQQQGQPSQNARHAFGQQQQPTQQQSMPNYQQQMQAQQQQQHQTYQQQQPFHGGTPANGAADGQTSGQAAHAHLSAFVGDKAPSGGAAPQYQRPMNQSSTSPVSAMMTGTPAASTPMPNNAVSTPTIYVGGKALQMPSPTGTPNLHHTVEVSKQVPTPPYSSVPPGFNNSQSPAPQDMNAEDSARLGASQGQITPLIRVGGVPMKQLTPNQLGAPQTAKLAAALPQLSVGPSMGAGAAPPPPPPVQQQQQRPSQARHTDPYGAQHQRQQTESPPPPPPPPPPHQQQGNQRGVQQQQHQQQQSISQSQYPPAHQQAIGHPNQPQQGYYQQPPPQPPHQQPPPQQMDPHGASHDQYDVSTT